MTRRSWLGLGGAAALCVLAVGQPAVTSTAAAGEPEIGVTAPDFTGRDTAGAIHRLSDYRGKTVVLEWTNHQCPFVAKHYGSGNMQALQKESAAAGIVWLSVISSAPGLQGHVESAEANALTDSRDAAPAAVLLDPDGTIGRLYGAKTTPHMYVVNPEGALVYKGGIDDRPTADRADIAGATNYVRAALADLAAGRSVETPVARPYGCSGKYGS